MSSGSSFDYGKLCQEAQARWLKPSEVFFILQNHEMLPIEQETHEKPLSGSLFLFNRRVLRFFRKDGHTWRKKKDGRAVGEAHERLKVGNVDALNCYYAHGDLNPYFQRRSYWMLDPAYDHIVLVHYREVSEGRFLPSQQPQEQLPSVNYSSNVNSDQFQGHPSATDSYQSSLSSAYGEVNSEFAGKNCGADCLNIINSSENSDLSSQSNVSQALRDLEEQLSLDKCDNNILENLLPVQTNEYKKLENQAFLENEKEDFQKLHANLIPVPVECSEYDQGASGKQKSQSFIFRHVISRNISPSWNEFLELSSDSPGISADVRPSDLMALGSVPEPVFCPSDVTGTHECHIISMKNGNQLSSEKENTLSVPYASLEQFSLQQPDLSEKDAEQMAGGIDLCSQLSAAKRFLLGSDSLDSPNLFACLAEDTLCIPTDATADRSNSKVMPTQKETNTDWMSSLDLPFEKNSHSLDFVGMWVDQGEHGAPLSTEQRSTLAPKKLFRIHEISPEWSFSFERTKVVITGEFFGEPSTAWAVMFDDIEVPAEIVQQGVIRCHAPEHATGKVALYITSKNREYRSEEREFEFRSKLNSSLMETLHHVNVAMNSKELLLLVKFVHILLCGSSDFSVSKGPGQTEAEYCKRFKATEEQWLQIIDQLQGGGENSSSTIDWVLQELIKDKFQQWLLSKINSNGDGNCLLSKEEQGIVHMISGLGYEWALNPILDIGVGMNFRDVNGWTALHWAAYFGREKMAAALLAAGASAGAVTDPTPRDPVGKTAGALAAAHGHKGLAAYLSEADLTSHLSSLTMEECTILKDSAAAKAEKAVESISERTAEPHSGVTEDDLSLKDSLAAVRNAAQAAARIQAAFRAHSFRKRHEKDNWNCDRYGMPFEGIYGITSSSKNQKTAQIYHDQKFNKAALSIQKKYRGWKGRKDFLTLCQHVVKIQAHVRGHQARKKYRAFLWTVGVLEKVVLRWRRRGEGFRGFRPEPIMDNEGDEEEDVVKAFRKQKVDAALEQAYSRVLSMVESPTARQQYRRMLERFHEAKAEQSSAEGSLPLLQDSLQLMQDDEFLLWL